MSQVVMDRGPAAQQVNIAAAGVPINNISLTVVGKGGPVLLIAEAAILGGAAPEVCEIRIRRNGAALDHSVASALVPITSRHQLSATAVVPDAAIGDVFDILALGGATADQDIDANAAQLTMVGLAASSAIAPQATATA